VQDHFHKKADTWDEGNIRVQGAKIIADAIKNRIHLNKEMQIMDFGAGTGLLGFEIAKSVKKVYAIDTSRSMLEKLEAKNTKELNIQIYCQDIIKEPINKIFDGIVSSMTLHHIKDLESFFKTIYKNLKKDAFIAIADLQTEDGTFHSDNTGVYHFGFDEKQLSKIILSYGFKDIKFEIINTITKTQKEFKVFLISAKK